MPTSLPVPTKNAGDLLTSSLWNSYLRDNINKLLQRSHRVVTVAQFAALSSPEGTKGTTPPDEVYVEVDASNGIVWHFHYESTETTYKWRFLGGPPMISSVSTSETTASTTYVDLATVGPGIVLPRGGDYDIIWTVTGNNSGNSTAQCAVVLGASTTNIIGGGWELQFTMNVGEPCSFFQRGRAVGRAASDEARLRYKVGANTGTFFYRSLQLTPTRII